ncbi:MAG TPA: hypothetical protein VIM07_04425 [Chitinophagaceae bacterium]
MPLINPSNLYHGAAVVLDSSPTVKFAAQLMAHQQAKRDALDQYYSKLQDQTLGQEDKMRPQDIQNDPNGKYKGWGSDFNDLQMFYMNPENKKNILNPSKDGYKTLNQYNAMHSSLIAKARDSKSAAADDKVIDTHRLSGKWNPTDADFNEVHQLSKSIYDKTRQITEQDPTSGLPITRDPSVSNLSVNYPAFDATKQMQFDKNVVGGIKPEKTYNEKNARVDKTTGEIFLPFNESYSPEKIKTIADNAGKINLRSPEGIHYTQQLNELAKNPDALETASKLYQSVYGKTNTDGNPNLVDTPQKVAQTEQIMKLQQAGKSGEEKVTDWQTKQRLQNQFAKEQQARSISAGYNKQQYGFEHTDKNKLSDDEINKYVTDGVDAVTSGDDNKINQWGKTLLAASGGKLESVKTIKSKVGAPSQVMFTMIEKQPYTENGVTKVRDVYVDHAFNANSPVLKEELTQIVGQTFKGTTAPNTKSILKNRGTVMPQTTTPSHKTISGSTIKSLVGKKGYEGYSEQEIKDYYKSNGYEVK